MSSLSFRNEEGKRKMMMENGNNETNYVDG